METRDWFTHNWFITMPDSLPATTATVAEMVIQNLQPHRYSIQKTIGELFERTAKKKELMQLARQETKVRETRQVLTEHFNLDPLAIRMTEQVENLSPQRRSKVLTEFMFLVNERGIAGDVPYTEEPETGPLYDRTRIGQRQGGDRYGPQDGAKAARAESTSVIRTKINLRLADEMMDRLRQGLPAMEPKPGRPSNVEKATLEYATVEVARELAEARRARMEHNLIEHEAAPLQDPDAEPQQDQGDRTEH